jgi:hypothetical protein
VCNNNLLYFVTNFVVLLTQKIRKLFETFLFLSVNLTIFARNILSKKWGKKKPLVSREIVEILVIFCRPNLQWTSKFSLQISAYKYFYSYMLSKF